MKKFKKFSHHAFLNKTARNIFSKLIFVPELILSLVGMSALDFSKAKGPISRKGPIGQFNKRVCRNSPVLSCIQCFPHCYQPIFIRDNGI